MHKQNADFSIYTSQDHYVKEISEISLTKVNTDNPDEPLSESLQSLFWSLLGALSWLQQTRADIAPYIGFLQRNAHKPNIGHIQKANMLLRYVRRVNAGILIQKLPPPLRMVTIADSAHKADDQLTECIALRGYIILVVGTPKDKHSHNGQFPGGPCTVLDWVSKKFNTVTRPSFCAELRNQLEAAQSSVFLSSSLEENIMQISS